jgi:hypothetical protein
MIVSQPVFFRGGGLWLSSATIASIVASVGAALWAIPEHGMYGAAWSMAAGFAVKFAVAAAASTYLYPLPWEISKIVRAILCGLAIAWFDTAFVDGWLPVVRDLVEPGSFWQRVEWLNVVALASVKSLLLASMVPLLWVTGVVSSREIAYVAQAARGKLRSWRTRWTS